MPYILALGGGLAMALCQILIFLFAPTERTMGLTQKIFYIHLPMAWWAMLSFLVVCVAGIMYLIKRDLKWDALGQAAAELGVVLAGLALFSGSIWAKHSWGVWWTWDPRLTTTLIMWFLYCGYLAFRLQDISQERKAIICSAIGIIAFVDVPLVFVSARWWRSIHPAVFSGQGGGLDNDMKITALACVFSFSLIWLALLILRTKQIKQQIRLENISN